MAKGTKFILLSTSFFFIAKLLVKMIPTIPAFEIVLFRALISFAICSVVIARKKIPFFGQHKKDLVLRGVFGTMGLLTFFYALQVLPLATATTLINLHPIFTIVFAIFIVKEKPKPKQWIFFGLAFVGVVLLKIGSIDFQLRDFLIGGSSAMFAGIAYNFIRKLKGKEDPQTIIMYLSLVAIPVFLPLTLWKWVAPNMFQWSILIGIGLITQFAQYFLTRAHQTSQASHIVHYSYFGVVGAVFFGWLFFDEALSPVSLGAIGLITACIFLINRYKLKN